MTPDDLTLGRVERVLVALPRRDPRSELTARLLGGCHRRLAKQTRPNLFLAPAPAGRGRLQAGTALAGALGLLYLAAVLGRALSLFGF
jgi:hypothetical protein